MTFPIYGKIKHVPNHQPDNHADHAHSNVFPVSTKFSSSYQLRMPPPGRTYHVAFLVQHPQQTSVIRAAEVQVVATTSTRDITINPLVSGRLLVDVSSKSYSDCVQVIRCFPEVYHGRLCFGPGSRVHVVENLQFLWHSLDALGFCRKIHLKYLQLRFVWIWFDHYVNQKKDRVFDTYDTMGLFGVLDIFQLCIAQCIS